MGFRSIAGGGLSALTLTACTVLSVDAEKGPPRVESDGLIEGHAAFGIRAEHDIVRLSVLDGESQGALAEFVLWRLFRLEIGALGVSVGVGPFDVGLGIAFYEPELPAFVGTKDASASTDPADCEQCQQTGK